MAITSNRQGHSPTWRSARNRCAVRTRQVLFFPGNAEFGQCRQVLPDRARSDFDKCQRLAIIADEIDLAFYTSRSVIAGHKDVPLPTQIPIGVGFSANSSAPGFQLFCYRWKSSPLRADREVQPSAPRETSVCENIGMVETSIPRCFAKYKQKSRGCHTSSVAATGLSWFSPRDSGPQ